MSKAFDFDDPERVRAYAETPAQGPGQFVPGFTTMHRLVIQLLRERAGETGEVLVLGAGGGLELQAFANAAPGWRFTAVDPSAPMLEVAKGRLGEAASRVAWVLGTIDAAPPGPFDAGSCLLTLHMIARDDKLRVLGEIRRRLKPGAPFAVVDNCLDPGAPDAETQLARFATHALESGADPEVVERSRNGIATASPSTCLTPAAEEALLREARFAKVELFFAGLSWRGWILHA